MRPFTSGAFVLLVFLLAGCRSGPWGSTQAAGPGDRTAGTEPTASAAKSITIPAGTAIEVRLLDVLSSATSRAGEKFLAALDQPILVHGWVAVPRGTNVTGQVVEAQPAGRGRQPELAVTLSTLLAGGRLCELHTFTVRAEPQAEPARSAVKAGFKDIVLTSEMRLRFLLERTMIVAGGAGGE